MQPFSVYAYGMNIPNASEVNEASRVFSRRSDEMLRVAQHDVVGGGEGYSFPYVILNGAVRNEESLNECPKPTNPRERNEWWPLIIVLSFFLSACGTVPSKAPTQETSPSELPFYNTSDLGPEWIAFDAPAYDSIHTIDTFSFIDQRGEHVTHETTAGKVYVANFFFTTCPGVCRIMTNELRAVQETYTGSGEVMILSHSVMPWVDTVAQLQRFEALYEIDGEMWKLLTGSKDRIYHMARTSYFADEGFGKSVTDSSDFLHTENVMLIDRKKRIRGVYNGTLELDVKRLIEDIEVLRAEDI